MKLFFPIVVGSFMLTACNCGVPAGTDGGAVTDAGGAVDAGADAGATCALVAVGATPTLFAGGTYPHADGPPGVAGLDQPYSLAFDGKGNLYAADYGTYSAIRQINNAGYTTTIAGNSQQGDVNENSGQPLTAEFHDLTGLAIDEQGNIFVGDQENNAIRKLDTAGNVTTFASATAPQGLALDASGNLYVAQYKVPQLLKIDPSGNATTLTYGPFLSPQGLAFDKAGNLYVSDLGNSNIYKVDTNGVTTLVAGSGSPGFADGQGAAAQFYNPSGLALDCAGNLLVADYANYALRRIDASGNVTTLYKGLGNGVSVDVGSGVISTPTGTIYFTNVVAVYQLKD
jgi:streptogramin lyase